MIGRYEAGLWPADHNCTVSQGVESQFNGNHLKGVAWATPLRPMPRLVTSTGDWQKMSPQLRYGCVDGGQCVAAEKNLSSRVECVRKAGLKSGLFVFPCEDRQMGLVPNHSITTIVSDDKTCNVSHSI